MIGLRRALWALAAAGLVVLAVETELLATADFAPDRGLWIALNWVIGGGFIGVGLFAWYRRPDNRVGALMVATGFAWSLSVLGRTEPSLLFTLGALLSNLFVATAIHLLLAFPSGRLGSSFDRALVGFAYFVTSVGFLPFIFTFESTGRICAGCPENVLLLEPDIDFAEIWLDGLSVVGIALLSLVVVRLAHRWREASPPLRRAVTPVVVAGAALMAMLAAVLAFDLAGVSEDTLDSAFYATLVPFGLVPYLFLGSLARARMLRGGAVSELVSRLGGTLGAGDLRRALAEALSDPSLELAYWIPDSEHYVDAEGRPVELPHPSRSRAVFDVSVDRRRVAAIIHDPSLLDEPELVAAVGAAAALALERERLEAELRAKIEELRESRSRLVAAGMAERRRLERDLHDGAQQRLVSLALDLRLARSVIRERPEEAERVLDGAGEELSRALDELRELARGIHPALLSDRGLEPAVESLASRAPLPVEVEGRLGERVPEPVELAAYYVVAEALTNVVKYAHAEQARVRLERENGRVLVEVADDGVGGADPRRGTGLQGLVDRISIIGGRLDIDSEPGAGTTVRARIPCE